MIVTFSFFCFIPSVRHMNKLLKATICTLYKPIWCMHVSFTFHINFRVLFGWLGYLVLVFWGPWIFFFFNISCYLYSSRNLMAENILCLGTQSNWEVQKRPLKIFLKRSKVYLKSPNYLTRQRVLYKAVECKHLSFLLLIITFFLLKIYTSRLVGHIL